MTYPGTKIREHTALESGLIQRVAELEKERDELVNALNGILAITDRNHVAWERARVAIARAGK